MHFKISRFNKATSECTIWFLTCIDYSTPITEMNDHMKQTSNEHYCVFNVLQWTPIKNKWPKKYDWIQSCFILHAT